MSNCGSKTYSTGQVAKICSLKSRRVAELFDKGEFEGSMQESCFRRRSTRRIRLDSLVRYMRKNRISLEGFGEDFDAQKYILSLLRTELKKSIQQQSERGGVLCRFRDLGKLILDVIATMDPLDNLDGFSEDRKRAMIFRKTADLMIRHINVRRLNAKKRCRRAS